jgi:hypothetical protein
MVALKSTLIMATVLIFGYRAAAAGEPHAAANQAFDQYIQQAEAAMGYSPQGSLDLKPLRIDSLPEAERARDYAALDRGEILIEKLPGKHDVPGGLIHHWVATALFQGASLDQALAVLEDYDRYAQIYAPAVQASRLTSHQDDEFHVFLRLRRKKVITATFNTEYDVHYFRLSQSEAAKHSISTRIRELDNSGNEKSPADDSGYLWRLNTYWRLRQMPKGTLAQCESISLSRPVPTGLGWLVGPFVESIPRDSLRFTLEATRKALTQK